jgi:hypothetical protein
MSREHFISRSVLRLIGDPHVAVNGAPWLREGETKALPVNELVARKILCKRHNAAMSPLDTAAGNFFAAIKSIYEDLGDNKTLSRKPQWWLLSGEELELWLLKTVFGLYYSGNVAKDRKKLCDVQRINRVLMEAFQGSPIPPPCGMYIMRGQDTSFAPNTLDLTSLSSDNNEAMVGLRFRFLGLSLLMLIDPLTVYTEAFLAGLIYRPHYIGFRNRLRTHTIALTWPRRSVMNAVMFDGVGPVRR